LTILSFLIRCELRSWTLQFSVPRKTDLLHSDSLERSADPLVHLPQANARLRSGQIQATTGLPIHTRRKNITPLTGWLPHLGFGSFWLRLRNSNRARNSEAFFFFLSPFLHINNISPLGKNLRLSFYSNTISVLFHTTWLLDFLSRAFRLSA
jgi:hypothetical protein